MIIGSIQNGYVIDHIPAGRGLELYGYLGLDELNCEVALIKNAKSSKMGRKDILKIDELIDLNFDILGFIDQHITVNVIKDNVRVEKIKPTLPSLLVGVAKCRNPRCITTTEQELQHVFKLTDRDRGVYRCMYCEMSYKK